MSSKREYNYDLLRILSTIAIIMLHVSATWFLEAIRDIAENGLLIEDIQSPFFICIYNSISRFAVPCFLLLSGAFILDNEHNLEYKKFYSKSFEKIGIPVIVFSLLYILCKIPFCFMEEDNGIIALLLDIIKGLPMYHMWYMYMLIGIYVMAPVVLRFKGSVSEKTFYKVAFTFLILASVSRWTTDKVRLSWDIGQSFEFLGYFLVGYSIRKMSRSKSNNMKAIIMIFLGIICEVCAAVLQYKQMIDGIADRDLKFQIVAPYSPLIVPASVLIFYGFTLLNIRKDMIKIGEMTFFIYLIHAGIWYFMRKLFRILGGGEFLNRFKRSNMDSSVYNYSFWRIIHF